MAESTDVAEMTNILGAVKKVQQGGETYTRPLQVTQKLKDTANKLKAGGCDFEEAARIIQLICYSEQEWGNGTNNAVDAIVWLEDMYKAGAGMNIPDRIADFILVTQGYFSVTECDKECQIVTQRDKSNRRQVLHRLVQKDILEKHPDKNGLFRKMVSEAPEIEWVQADIENVYRMQFPFEIEKYVLLYPKNIVVIAGVGNQGKTALMLNLIKMNMNQFKIHYFNSEMGAEELKVRLSKFTDIAENEWLFDPRERSFNFSEVVYPDDLNLIDYLELSEGNFYKVAHEIRGIHDKLRKGVAVIALQKKEGAEFGRGADLSAEKARLYLTMDSNILKIKKGKNWAQQGLNPNNMEFPYKLIDGAKFISG
jgi:hypothetical protein